MKIRNIRFAGLLILSLLSISLLHAHKKRDDIIRNAAIAVQSPTHEMGQMKEHEESILEELIIPFGIATLTLLLVTLTTGFLIQKNRAVILPWHKRLAILTASVALLHLLTVLLAH